MNHFTVKNYKEVEHDDGLGMQVGIPYLPAPKSYVFTEVIISGTAQETWGVPQENIRHLLAKFLIQLIQLNTAAGILPADPEWPNKIHLSPQNVPDKDRLFTKQCKYQLADDLGAPICRASKIDDSLGGQTSQSLCRSCQVPDQAILCSHAVHAQVSTSMTMGLNISKREGFSLYNMRGAQAGSGECVPWGKECWEKIMTPPSLVESDASDLQRQIANTIELINLYLKPREKRIIPIKHATLIADLGKKCMTFDDFKSGAITLGTLIDGMKFAKIAPKPPKGNADGSIYALKRFLDSEYPEQGRDVILLLNAIRTVRNYSGHSSADTNVLEAFKFLEIEHPIYNYNIAWTKLRLGFLTALSKLTDIVRYE